MSIIINRIKLPLTEDESSLCFHAARTLGVNKDAIRSVIVRRVSLDARKKNDICHEYTVEVTLSKADEARAIAKGAAAAAPEEKPFEPKLGSIRTGAPVIVAGLGPAGLFAAYTLARFGYRPLVIERGKPSEERRTDVERFWSTGRLDYSSNAMFGEGGAGAFSDGKLTTRIKDPLSADVMKTLVRFGAPGEIEAMAKPHIGTDRLTAIVSDIRRECVRLGAEVRFQTSLTGFETKDGKLAAVRVSAHDGREERIECAALILATGQNADDTYRMLFGGGLTMQAKPFAAGVRIEHPREFIDRSQFGAAAGNPRLGAAEYHFADRSGDRGVYTFCMCPGGRVVACSNDEGRVIVNGMSEYARADENSNAAIVVQVDERDFPAGPLGGLDFREKLERAAFAAGGGDYCAPACTVGAMLKNRKQSAWGDVRPSYRPGVKICTLSAVLPDFMTNGVKDGIRAFGLKLKGFDMDDAVLCAVESRTSAPVRILRDEMGEAPGAKGLYPCGEGAGYAGGIVSAAVDGMRTAEHVMAVFAPLSH